MPDYTAPGGLVTYTVEGAATVRCPLDGCQFAHTETAIDLRLPFLDDVFGRGALAQIAQVDRDHRLEQAVRAHLRNHRFEEWVVTISRLRARLEAADIDPNEAITAICDDCGGEPRAFPNALDRGIWVTQHMERTRHYVRFGEEVST